jgi:type II secretory ATPase GspE/PulE/Tfp pilus assembly ATPase PilB-like protein
MPTRFGERVTLRLLPGGPAGVALDQLGLSDDVLAALRRAVDSSDGLVLVCGPTGSGKTTTLHALLSRLAAGARNVVTLEDPIERIVIGASQTQVDAANGLGFADGLRHLLRHDPDVILVGEVRDSETARLAIEAAHTGHLVLSTLHAVDAPAALTRLSELGITSPMLADTVRVVVAQRLLAVPCPECDGTGGRGRCAGCGGAGTRGRSAIAEHLALDEPLRQLLRDGRGPAVHHPALSGAVSPHLREVALARVAAGLARVDDAMRSTPEP